MSNQYTWLLSKDKLIINGVSSDTVGIFVDTPPMPPMPEEKIEQNFTHGRAESTVYHTGQYNDITISVNCYIFDYGYHPDQIYKFLSGAETLAFSSSNRYYYRVKQVKGISPAYSGGGKNVLSVQFVCSPFKYGVLNPTYTFTKSAEEESKTIQIYNAGSVYCEPVFWLSVGVNHQPAEITVNGTKVTVIHATTGETYIDLQIMEVYNIQDNGEKYSWQSTTQGKWWDMILQPGYNEITWTSSETLKITKNERWI